MKPPVVLAVLIGILVLACSTAAPAPVEPTPDIDATVEARAKELVTKQPTANPYPTYTSVLTATPSPNPTNTPTLVPTATSVPTPMLRPILTAPIPSPVPTATAVPTPTPMPMPTATAVPTPTPMPVPTATAVPTPTPMPMPTATPVPIVDDHGDNVISASVNELNPDFNFFPKYSVLQIIGELETPDDVDYFSFEAYGGKERFTFRPRFLPLATDLGGGIPQIALYGASWPSPLASIGLFEEYLSYVPWSPGIIYLSVSNYNPGYTGKYRIVVERTATSARPNFAKPLEPLLPAPTPTPAPTATPVTGWGDATTPALANFFGTISVLNENVGGSGYGFSTGSADVDSTNHRYLAFTTHVISIDTQTGNLTEGPSLSTSFIGMKYDEGSGKLFGITNCCPNEFVSID